MDRVTIFGIRHHGPGSARSLKAALEALQPDAILIEGPPEADDLLPLILSPDMRPPVALLIYALENPSIAAYYPFAEYSPEWQALRYGIANDIPAQMIDLPQSVQMAMGRKMAQEAEARDGEISFAADADPNGAVVFDSGDPLRMLAEAAGYSESEQWWEHMVEQHRGGGQGELFAAILEAMTALREASPPETHPIAARREAAMRYHIRAALDDGCRRAAVVCGAWHAPALVHLNGEEEDLALLQNMPAIKVQATWVPWTNARLTRQSGYGAGIESPGWYQHLWANDSDVAQRWMISAARLLREEDLDISPAHVIEAVRLAETLAALRGRPLPGLPELNEAALTVFCFGNPTPLRLIEEKLIIGDRLGRVPAETPAAPLQQDFEREARRLRLKARVEEKLLDLDLRKPFDLARSRLLHRLNLLGVPWGKNNDAALQSAGGGRGGTFHEIWTLKWQPEFAVLLIDAGQWGNTIERAAAERVRQEADLAPDLPTLTRLVEDTLLAELPGAVHRLIEALQAQAAVANDTRHLMQALPPLAGVLRYGNVRQTDLTMIAAVVDGLAARICIGLPSACTSLNDDAAVEMYIRILEVDEAVNRLSEERYSDPWRKALAQLAGGSVHGLVAGRACRILFDQGILSGGEAARRLGLALSTAGDPMQAASWIEGFLRGSGQLLIYDDALLGILDGWLAALPERVFVQLLPLLRRTFATFAHPERRSIGEKLRRGLGQSPFAASGGAQANFDSERASAALPALAALLGIETEDHDSQE